MKTITIEGQIRTEFGKSATRQLRSQEMVPGVIYGGAQEVNFSATAKAFGAASNSRGKEWRQIHSPDSIVSGAAQKRQKFFE